MLRAGKGGRRRGSAPRFPPPPPRAGSVWGRGCGWGRCGAAGLAGPAAGPARPGPSAAPRPAGASAHIGCAGMGPSRPEPRLCHLSNTLHPACSPPPALPLPFPPTPSSPFFFLVVFGCWFFVLVFLVFFFFLFPLLSPPLCGTRILQAGIHHHPPRGGTLPPAPGKCGARGGPPRRCQGALAAFARHPSPSSFPSLPPPPFSPSFSFCVSRSSC